MSRVKKKNVKRLRVVIWSKEILSYAMGNGDNGRKRWSSFEKNKNVYGEKYAGDGTTSEKSNTRDQETTLVSRLLLWQNPFCPRQAYLLTPSSSRLPRTISIVRSRRPPTVTCPIGVLRSRGLTTIPSSISILRSRRLTTISATVSILRSG
jgi:hypothetical protein